MPRAFWRSSCWLQTSWVRPTRQTHTHIVFDIFIFGSFCSRNSVSREGHSIHRSPLESSSHKLCGHKLCGYWISFFPFRSHACGTSNDPLPVLEGNIAASLAEKTFQGTIIELSWAQSIAPSLGGRYRKKARLGFLTRQVRLIEKLIDHDRLERINCR